MTPQDNPKNAVIRRQGSGLSKTQEVSIDRLKKCPVEVVETLPTLSTTTTNPSVKTTRKTTNREGSITSVPDGLAVPSFQGGGEDRYNLRPRAGQKSTFKGRGCGGAPTH